MKAADQALLLSAVRCAHANGWRPTNRQIRGRNVRSWNHPGRGLDQVVATLWEEGSELHVYLDGGWLNTQPQTVQQAVDVLAALGVLPCRLGSQYQDGYNAGHRDGCGAVTEMSVQSALETELEERFGRLDDPALTAKIGPLLLRGVDPFWARHDAGQVVAAVKAVLDAD